MVLHIDSWFRSCCKEEMSEHLDIVLNHTVNLAWLKSSTTELQQLEYFKSVFLVILNVPLRTVFAETVTYTLAS